tara:strand:+ start:13809 stop:14558 length:750 start_codon:yes stop_codon:yes gene_type:complete
MTEITLTSEIKVEATRQMGGDHMVVAAARVSTAGDDCMQYNEPNFTEENYGLINYLMKHKHGTPFEHGSITFFVRAPIFVWREWHRHRIGFSYNEESGRYKKLEPEFYIPNSDRPLFKLGDNWKPGHPKFRTIDKLSDEDFDKFEDLNSNLIELYKIAYCCYEDNLKMGFDPGIARACLPVAIMSSCWVTCNPRSLMAFLALRTHEPTANHVSYPLYEIEVAARKCEDIFAEYWPLTYKSFCENGRTAP